MMVDEDRYVFCRVFFLRGMNRCYKFFVFIRVLGVYYGYLEVIVSGWKLGFFLKGVLMDFELYEI